MEVVENKEKYLRRESRWQKTGRILRKFIWVLPILAITIGLLIAWHLIRGIQAERTVMPEVNYEKYLEPDKKPKKEVKKLEQYKEQMKKEKEQKITSRYERIISGKEIVGKVDYGKVIPPEENITEKKAENHPNTPPIKETVQEEPKKSIPVRKQEPSPREQANPKGPEKEKKTEVEILPTASLSDSIKVADTLQKEEKAQDPFHTLKASETELVRYTKAHFYGDQDILNGSFIRLRLGEDMLVNGKRIARNTIFRGIASLSQNKIEIKIDRIGSQEIEGMICDQDYNPGIVIPASKGEGVEEAVNRSIYQTGGNSAMDLPYEILQDVSRNIIRNKRRKQSTIRINDGYLVYITLTKN